MQKLKDSDKLFGIKFAQNEIIETCPDHVTLRKCSEYQIENQIQSMHIHLNDPKLGIILE